jgi:hypothetical protein
MMKSKALLSLAVLCTFHSVHHPMPYYFFSEPRISHFHYQMEIQKLEQLVRKKTEMKAYICKLRLSPDSDTRQSNRYRLSTKTTNYQAATPGED